MSTQMVASARAAAAKEAQDAADAGRPLARPQQIKLPQMEVSAIATTVDGRREVLLRDANDPQNTASMQYPRGIGDPAVQFTVGQTVNFEPTGNDQGWQLKDNQGRPLEYLPEATGRATSLTPGAEPPPHADQEVSMLRCLRVPTTALLLSALLVPTVHAGAAPQLNSSEASVIVTSFVVLSLPLAASMGLSELSKAPFKASERNARATRTKAVPLPPMEVKKVETTPTGERQVQLQVPDKADHTATLRWPVQPQGENPAAAFVVGQRVHFDHRGRCRLEREARRARPWPMCRRPMPPVM